MLDAIEEFYDELRDNLVRCGRQSWKHSHTDRILSRRMRKSFQRTHHVYYPREARHILVKNQQLAQSGSELNFFDKEKLRRLTDHDLEISPLAEAMYVADAREALKRNDHVTAIYPPATEIPQTALEVPPPVW